MRYSKLTNKKAWMLSGGLTDNWSS